MSPVAAKAKAAGRRRGNGMRPLMGWGGGNASVEAVSVVATGGSWTTPGGPPVLGAGHAASRSVPRSVGTAAAVPEPLVARRPTMPGGCATVGKPLASGVSIGACGAGAAVGAELVTAAPAIAGTGGGEGGAGAPVSDTAARPIPPALVPASASGGADIACWADCAADCAVWGGGGLTASGDAGGGLGEASVRAKCWKVGALGCAT